VVADLIDIARGEFGPAYAMPVDALATPTTADTGERRGRAYVRFTVADKVGVLAEIAAAMRDAGVSIESFIQKGRGEDDGVVIVALVTHEAPESAVSEALQMLKGAQSLAMPPLLMQIIGG
jgi:homoserine dehydrogenase